MAAEMVARLCNYFRAGYPCVAIETSEEKRALADVLAAARKLGRGFATWSATDGVRVLLPAPAEVSDSQDLLAALGERRADSVLVLLDVQSWSGPFGGDPRYSRALRDLLIWAPGVACSVVMIGASALVHPTCEKYVTVVDYPLPSAADLQAVAAGVAESAGEAMEAGADVLRALSGLGTAEAENALALAVIETGERDGEKWFDPSVIYREKVAAVKRGGVLDVIAADPRGLDAIGGWDVAKRWAIERAAALAREDEAAAFSLPASSGVLVGGVPGAGKSLFAACVGMALGVPTLACDVGALFDSKVGESGQRARDLFRTAEALAPCVVRLDEVEKGFAGTAQGGDNTGVSMQVLATFLSGMQDFSDRGVRVFWVATSNDTWLLPAPILRRFEEVFYVDLPTRAELAEILAIQLRAVKRDPAAFENGDDPSPYFAVVDAMAGFVGAEVQKVVRSALFKAFSARRELSAADLLEAARGTVPLSRTAKEQVERVREWAKGRAVNVSSAAASIPASSNLRKLG